MIHSIVVRRSIVSFFLLTLTLKTVAQEVEKTKNSNDFSFLTINKDKMISPELSIESWLTYSMGEEKSGTEYANRVDASFRRFRFGASGLPYDWLSYNFQLYLDRLGEDAYAATKGSYEGLGIWNACITAKLLKENELLNLQAGYYWAAISREFNTSPWAIGSFDKTRSDWYMRYFVTGKGNGIESGIGLGGLKNFKNWGISYRLGTYEPQLYESSKYASRLYTGRIMVSIGDPEETTYKYMLCGNQWRKRNGVTLGLGASSQSNGKLTDTTYFTHSTAYGADILINYIGLRIDGEYFKLNRKATDLESFNGSQWHIRTGYSLIIAHKYIEPTITYDKYEGSGDATLYKYIGYDKTLDLGVNWYLNKDKLKFALHYVIQKGSVSSNVGDYIGMACQFRL
jgi:hypothetical protein